MKSNSTYLLELFIKKCRIITNQPGSVGLLLRAGKSQSHVTDMQPIVQNVISFNTRIRLNIDEYALDTQRCSLTLNFMSAENSTRRVIGIVVISIPPLGEQVEKTFKITSTPDKEAEIELCVSVNELDENMRVKPKQKSIIEVQSKRQSSNLRNTSNASNAINQNKYKSIGEQLLALTASKVQEKPTSPPSESTEKLNLKSKRSEIDSFVGQHEEFIATIEKLQREKQMLKELLKLEILKSAKACAHLKNIVDVLQAAIGVNTVTSPQQTPIRQTVPGEPSSVLRKNESLDLNKLSFALSSPGFNTVSQLGVVKESKFQDTPNPPFDSRTKSHLSHGSERSVDLMNVLTSLKKKMEESGQSKTQIKKMLDKIKNDPILQLDSNKLRVLKTKIDKSYLKLIGKEAITKEEVLRHKIEVNKILDEVVVNSGGVGMK